MLWVFGSLRLGQTMSLLRVGMWDGTLIMGGPGADHQVQAWSVVLLAEWTRLGMSTEDRAICVTNTVRVTAEEQPTAPLVLQSSTSAIAEILACEGAIHRQGELCAIVALSCVSLLQSERFQSVFRRWSLPRSVTSTLLGSHATWSCAHPSIRSTIAAHPLLPLFPSVYMSRMVPCQSRGIFTINAPTFPQSRRHSQVQ
jgi:hypothetical protein